MGTGSSSTTSGRSDRLNAADQNISSRGTRAPTVPGGPYSFFPVENKGILSDEWCWDIIYDPEQTTPPPFLLTLDRNDERCVLEGAMTGAEPANYDDDWQMLGLTGGRSEKGGLAGGEEDHAKNARASFNVTFGLAATRGMFTGALAKAEKGAEKVKRIFGKVSVLHLLLCNQNRQTTISSYNFSHIQFNQSAIIKIGSRTVKNVQQNFQSHIDTCACKTIDL